MPSLRAWHSTLAISWHFLLRRPRSKSLIPLLGLGVALGVVPQAHALPSPAPSPVASEDRSLTTQASRLNLPELPTAPFLQEAPSSEQPLAKVSYQILFSWSIPEPELAKLFTYAYQYQLPLLLQGFNQPGEEASIRSNQLRVANLIAKYELRGIPQVYVDERPFAQLDYAQVRVLVQVAQPSQRWSPRQPARFEPATKVRLLYQQYGNVSLEALASECPGCARRQQLQQELTAPTQIQELGGAQPTSAQPASPFPFPQPDITQVGTVVKLPSAFRQQSALPRVRAESDLARTASSSSSLSLSSLSRATSEFNALLNQITPARVLGKVYPIAEQAFSDLARSHLAQAQAEGKLDFKQVRSLTPQSLLEQTRALKTTTLAVLRNRIEQALRELEPRKSQLGARLEQLQALALESPRTSTARSRSTTLREQLTQLEAQELSLRQALDELAQGDYPLMQAQRLQQIDFRPNPEWQLPSELVGASSEVPTPLLRTLLLFVDLSNPTLQTLLQEYFLEWHWLISQTDCVVLVTDISPPGSASSVSVQTPERPDPSELRHAFNYWLGSGKQAYLFNASLSQTFSPTAFTTVQQATSHDLVATNLTLPRALRGKVLVRDWSIADIERWLRYIRTQRQAQLPSY